MIEDITSRVNNVVELCWESFSAKVGNGLISINKEASMQLQFAYLLKNTLDLAVFVEDESVRLELETGIQLKGKLRECDMLIRIQKEEQEVILPIEMKCYKTWSSSGGRRGAQDIFRYNLYQDLELLEAYQKEKDEIALGVQLTMTDSRNFVFPKSKDFKSWQYDISDGAFIHGGTNIEVAIGGKPTNILLERSYQFKWKKVGEHFFLKLQGQ